MSALTGKKVKPINNSAGRDHLLHCNYLTSFDNFSILAHENEKFLLKIKESLLIMRDKPSLNRNISSAPLYLFDKSILNISGTFHGSSFNLISLFPFKHHCQHLIINLSNCNKETVSQLDMT